MNLPTSIFFFLLVSGLLISCGGTTHYLAAGKLSDTESYQVNSYYGCCGCEAKYFQITVHSRKTEQVIYSYNCSGSGSPTKFIFHYDKGGRIVSCDQYVATISGDFIMPLNDYEKKLFSMVDGDSLLKADYISIRFADIKGFRKPADTTVAHSFPLIKKAHRIPVN